MPKYPEKNLGGCYSIFFQVHALENFRVQIKGAMTSVLPKFRTNFTTLCHLSKSGAQWCHFAFNYYIFIFSAFLFIICSFRNAVFYVRSCAKSLLSGQNMNCFFRRIKQPIPKLHIQI